LSILFFFIVIPRLMFPDLDHSDEWADANVLTAGENFFKFGFVKCRFLPSFEYSADKPKGFYTHYPPLSEIINGVFQQVRIHSLYFFRGFALFFAFLNILFWYLFVKKLSGSSLIGLLATLFYFTNSFFIYGMDSLQQLSYSDCLRSLILLIFIMMLGYLSAGRRIYIVILWILLFIESLMSFEYIMYFSLFYILFGILLKELKNILSQKVFFVLSSASIGGFFLHFLQNSWYFGSFSLAFHDLKDSFLKRTTGGYELPQGLQFSSWFKYVILRNFSLVFYFDTFVVLLSIFFAFLLYSKLSDKSREETKKLFYLFIIFIICGISWYVFFPSHSLAHAFVNFLPRHLVPAAAIGFTIFTYIIYSFLKENNLWKNAYLRTSWILIVGVIIFTGIFKSELPITLDKIRRAQDFKVFTHCLLKLREISSEKDDIGVNYYRFPFIRYYTHRHCSAIFDKDSMEKLPTLPHYFIFIPYNDQKSQELFQFLQEKYTPLWQCDSSRFPAIFFKLKGD